MARAHSILRNIARAVADALLTTLPDGYDANLWKTFQPFMQCLNCWQHAKVNQNVSNDIIRDCAMSMYHVICDLQAQGVLAEQEWNTFILHLDKRRLVGVFGTLQSVSFFAQLAYLCMLPGVNVTLLGIRHILSKGCTIHNFANMLTLVHESSDDYDARRRFDPDPVLHCDYFLKTTATFRELFNLGYHLQYDLLMTMIWALKIPETQKRADMFPIIAISTTPPPKKDFLVFLRSPAFVQQKPCFTMITISSRHIVIYKPRFNWLYETTLFLNIFWCLYMFRAVHIAWQTAYCMLQLKNAKYAIGMLSLLLNLKAQIQSCVLQTRLRNIFLMRYGISKWVQTARLRLKLESRRKLRNNRKKDKKQQQRNQNNIEKKAKLQNTVCIIMQMRLKLHLMAKRAIATAQNNRMLRETQRFVEEQNKFHVFMQTVQGKRNLANFHMLRSLLKQLLRVVVKCLTFFSFTLSDGDKNKEFHAYIGLFTFSVEPFLFSIDAYNDMKTNPNVKKYMQVTEDMTKLKFCNDLLTWMLSSKVMHPYVGCMSIFRYVPKLFLQLHNHIMCIPNNTLQNMAFVPFSTANIDVSLYKVFCAKYADLAITWCIEGDTLATFIEGWLHQGGKNIDLLDMLTKIQQAYGTMCRNNKSKQQKEIIAAAPPASKTRRVMFRVRAKDSA